jgi:hypothetical protein
MDSHFETFGAKRFHNRVDIDLEDWNKIDRWFAAVLAKLSKLELEVKQDYLWEKASSYQKKSSFDRRKPFFATLKVNFRQNHPNFVGKAQLDGTRGS